MGKCFGCGSWNFMVEEMEEMKLLCWGVFFGVIVFKV